MKRSLGRISNRSLISRFWYLTKEKGTFEIRILLIRSLNSCSDYTGFETQSGTSAMIHRKRRFFNCLMQLQSSSCKYLDPVQVHLSRAPVVAKRLRMHITLSMLIIPLFLKSSTQLREVSLKWRTFMYALLDWNRNTQYITGLRLWNKDSFIAALHTCLKTQSHTSWFSSQ